MGGLRWPFGTLDGKNLGLFEDKILNIKCGSRVDHKWADENSVTPASKPHDIRTHAQLLSLSCSSWIKKGCLILAQGTAMQKLSLKKKIELVVKQPWGTSIGINSGSCSWVVILNLNVGIIFFRERKKEQLCRKTEHLILCVWGP